METRQGYRVMQQTLLGGPQPATGHWLRDELAQMMTEQPELQHDEDLLTASWLREHRFWEVDLETLREIAHTIRKHDFRRRRQELRDLFPYSEEEEKRRQARSKQGPP